MPVETNAHMLKYDSTYGRFPHEVEVRDGNLYVKGEMMKSYAEREPANLPWGDLGVDIVLECTGRFKDRENAAKHLAGGAQKVIVSAPGKDMDGTFVMGVNQDTYDPDSQHILSNASCTTNCLAPAAKVLHDNFGIERALMTTVHAVTNGQAILDVAGSDLRRARTAFANIIPTTTGAARATGLVIPDLQGKIDGMAFRVPVVTGSVTDLTAILNQDVSLDDVKEAYKAASADEGWLGKVLEYTEEPIVSTDIVGSRFSSIIDGLAMMQMGGNMVKVISWYDNEWGYASRLADLAAFIAKRL
jgi:glyceraldehyde 3-phosphate dehydrogenase